jgi:agmatine deiminase
MRWTRSTALAVSAVLLGGAAASGTGSSDSEAWIFPGEYESHGQMWMLWPTYENKAGFPSTEPMVDMIATMSGHVRVTLVVQDEADLAMVESLLDTSEVPLEHVDFLQLPHFDIWAREHGTPVHPQHVG